jgi:molybdopterin converting factor small subunit
MLKRKIYLQLFANLEDIITQNAQAFEGSNIKDTYGNIAAKLGELGYDVLINNKKQAEFVPASRLSEVVTQRDSFKTQLETANVQLETMKKSATGNDALQKQLQDQIDANSKLLKDIEGMKVQTEIFVAAKDAINAKDLMAFIDMSNIKVNAKGEVIGVEAEINRLKTEKPYLFNNAQQSNNKGKKAGMDNGGGAGAGDVNMNSIIRRAAGRS